MFDNQAKVSEIFSNFRQAVPPYCGPQTDSVLEGGLGEKPSDSLKDNKGVSGMVRVI